jgi:hypothetical protein
MVMINDPAGTMFEEVGMVCFVVNMLKFDGVTEEVYKSPQLTLPVPTTETWTRNLITTKAGAKHYHNEWFRTSYAITT